MTDADRPAVEPGQVPPLPARRGSKLHNLFHSLPVWIPPLFFLVLALIFLWRSVLAGEVFLPATLLGHVAPWKGTALYPASAEMPPWNPLRWDGIGQFYPWRKFAAETLRAGYIPLWNPFQFCGTPFVANSQSAVFYPGNLLFLLIPDTAYAFGWSAVLHLTLCGWFAYLLMRKLRCSEIAALLGGVIYAYSSWQAAWLQLPTFLATSCWFPMLLRQIYDSAGCGAARGHTAMKLSGNAEWGAYAGGLPILALVGSACKIGAVVGLMLLAGHLQIALYGLLAGTCFAVGLLVVRRAPLSRLFLWLGALALGLMLALPQLLPAIELSRMSHRVGKPSAAGFRSYTAYALPAAGVVQLILPDYFGGDSDPKNPYWGYYEMRGPDLTMAVYHNPSETAVYVGILPLILGLFACARGLRRGGFDGRVGFFALLALLAMLLALGTPVNALFYYGIPGFAQSGSPARCLVLWALAAAALAALGLDALGNREASGREIKLVFGAFVLAALAVLRIAARAHITALPGIPNIPLLTETYARIAPDWIRLGLFLAASIGFLVMSALRGRSAEESPSLRMNYLLPAALLLVVVDLFWTSIGINPTASRARVYPVTEGIAFLREHGGHNRIMPVNQFWSLFASPPVTLPAVLPPNGATVFGLRDVQGYDSLFSGRYKAYANGFARLKNGVRDASPIEVGNIVFFQNANAPGVPDTGAAYVLAVPYDQTGFPSGAVPSVTPQDTGDAGMMVYELAANPGRARLSPNVPGATITWEEDLPTRVTLAVDTPSATTFSLLDAAMPGWRLRVDARPVPIATRPDNPVFRGVALPAGRHTVAFRYEPASFRIGLFAACTGLLALSLCGGLLFANKSLQFASQKHENIPG